MLRLAACGFGAGRQLAAACSGGSVQSLFQPGSVQSLFQPGSVQSLSKSYSVQSLFKSFPRPPARNPRVSAKLRRRRHRVRQWSEPDPERSFLYERHFARYEMQLEALRRLAVYETHGRLRPESSDAAVDEAAASAAAPAECPAELLTAERLNADWNSESGRLRERQMRADCGRLRRGADARAARHQLLQQQTVLAFHDRLRRDLADSPGFVTADNLDEKVEEILDSPVVGFNFAVDPAGNALPPSEPRAQ